MVIGISDYYLYVVNTAGNLELKHIDAKVAKNLKPIEMPESFKQAAKKFDINKLIGSAPVYLGADPEIFVTNKQGIIIPAFSFLPDKETAQITRPISPDDRDGTTSGGAGKVYNDGFQAEFDSHPFVCISWLIDTFHVKMKEILEKARAKFGNDVQLCSDTVLDVPEEFMLKAAERHVQFGCMPSMNIYGDRGQVVDGKILPFRFAGGHIHVGQVPKSEAEIVRIVKAMDALVGCLSIALWGKTEDPRRRIFYGRAGEYRLPKHGLEYRVVSSRMLRHPFYANMMFESARRAFKAGNTGLFELAGTFDEELVRSAINESHVGKARKVLVQNKNFLKPWMDEYDKNAWRVVIGTKKLKMAKTLEEDWGIAKNSFRYHWHGESPNCSIRKMVVRSVGKTVVA